MDRREVSQGQQEGLGSLAGVTLGGDRSIELLGQGQAGEREIHPLGFIKSDPHVLEKVLNEKARFKVRNHHPGAKVVQRP